MVHISQMLGVDSVEPTGWTWTW